MRINKIFSQKSKLSLAKIRLIARLKGDGCVMRIGKRKTNYYLKYEGADYCEINQFAKDIKEVYGLEPKFGLHRSGKNPLKLLPLVFIRSKLAYEDIIKYGPFSSSQWKVPNEILNASRKNKIEFIRTFAEDEGTVTSNQIRIYSINLYGLNQISQMLITLGIVNKIFSGYGQKRNVYAIVIGKKDYLIKFSNIVGFRSDLKNFKLSTLIS